MMRTSLGLVLLICLACLVLALGADAPSADPPETEAGGDGRPRPAAPPPRLEPSAPGGDVTAEERSGPACMPGLCALTVRVVDQDGCPVGHVSVAAQDEDGNARGGARSTRAGRVVLKVAPGRWRIGARDRQRGVYDWSVEQLDLRPGTTTHHVVSVVR